MSKVARLATVDDGARVLGTLLESIYGPDWRPAGNGTYRAPAPRRRQPRGAERVRLSPRKAAR